MPDASTHQKESFTHVSPQNAFMAAFPEPILASSDVNAALEHIQLPEVLEL
jgi:hypothetical protein